MSTEKKNEGTVGIIGQMYEDRKTKKVGVLESREEKFKTLMLRDKEGKSFNITYSTFRSNWRKYQGEELIQTSTQVEEQATEEKRAEEKRAKDNKKAIEKQSEVVKMTTEDKVKALKALAEVVSELATKADPSIKVDRTSKGGLIVRFKKHKLFELWIKFGKDKYEFVSRDELVDMDKSAYNAIAESTDSEYVFHDKWVLKHQYKVTADSLTPVLEAHIQLAKLYADSKTNTTEEEG